MRDKINRAGWHCNYPAIRHTYVNFQIEFLSKKI